MFAAVHSDTPASPHVVHIAIHKDVLTIQGTGPSFAKQESPGLRVARRFWGRGANGPQRSERLLAMSLRCPGTPAVHGIPAVPRNPGRAPGPGCTEDPAASGDPRA